MSMRGSKYRILMLYRLLEEYTDETNPLTAAELLNLLSEHGVESERKTIYSDIKVLKEAGCDIVCIRGALDSGYFMATRKFEIPEVILLIDAVTSAGFITPKKTKSLVEKLKSLVSHGQADSLISRVYVDSSAAKCSNEEIYITIDRLHEAIMQEKMVKFVYRRRNIDFQNKKRYTEKTFSVSPYALIWKDDHYYLVCNNQKYDNLMNLRIDRIKKLEVLEKKARPVNEVSSYEGKLDTQDYSSHMFNMFSGEKCMVKLRCSLKLQEEMFDRFGSSVSMLTCGDLDHFETTVEATMSDGFVSWLMQYGADIKVLEPLSLAEKVKEKALKIAEIYN